MSLGLDELLLPGHISTKVVASSMRVVPIRMHVHEKLTETINTRHNRGAV